MRALASILLITLVAACAGRSFEIGPSPRGVTSVSGVGTSGAPSGTPGSPLPVPVAPGGSTAIPISQDVEPDGLASTGAVDEGLPEGALVIE